MEWISLELKLISCKDLKAFNFFHKLAINATVSIFDSELRTAQQRKKSPVDKGRGGNPEWNHQMEFNLEQAAPEDGRDRHHTVSNLYLKFDIRREGVELFNYRTIGKVRVPLSDLIDGASDFNGMVKRLVSYQVRTSDGRPNGVLNFSYKLKGKAIKKELVAPLPPPRSHSPMKSSNGDFSTKICSVSVVRSRDPAA